MAVAEVAAEALEAAEAEVLVVVVQVQVLAEAEVVPTLDVQVQVLAVLHLIVLTHHQTAQDIQQVDMVVDSGVYQELLVQLL